jgi:hypothetical protein
MRFRQRGKAGRPQTPLRVHLFSSTAIVHVYIPINGAHPRGRHGLRRGSAASRLLGLWVRIPQGTWISVSCECCVLSGKGLYLGLITRQEESYQV